jgi:hypothetical protein
MSQDRGSGMLIQGTRRWQNYEVRATYRPHLLRRGGLAARVQGLKRYYALLLDAEETVRLIKALDGETVLAEADFPWTYDEHYDLRLRVSGNRIKAWIDDQPLFEITDDDRPLLTGAIALVCEEGRVDVTNVRVSE